MVPGKHLDATFVDLQFRSQDSGGGKMNYRTNELPHLS
jgi:hypothetical protein